MKNSSVNNEKQLIFRNANAFSTNTLCDGCIQFKIKFNLFREYSFERYVVWILYLLCHEALYQTILFAEVSYKCEESVLPNKENNTLAWDVFKFSFILNQYKLLLIKKNPRILLQNKNILRKRLVNK